MVIYLQGPPSLLNTNEFPSFRTLKGNADGSA